MDQLEGLAGNQWTEATFDSVIPGVFLDPNRLTGKHRWTLFAISFPSKGFSEDSNNKMQDYKNGMLDLKKTILYLG